MVIKFNDIDVYEKYTKKNYKQKHINTKNKIK